MAALRALWAEKLIFSLKTLQCWIDLTPKHMDQQPVVNPMGIPDPSLTCEGGAADGSTSSEPCPSCGLELS